MDYPGMAFGISVMMMMIMMELRETSRMLHAEYGNT
jgi:hypothetical protein